MLSNPSKTRRGLARLAAVALLIASTLAGAQSPGRCDANADRVIDLADINAILAALNRPASGPADPRDADGNGTINILDARSCQQRCTRPACSTQNLAPIAHAGPDQTAGVGATVRLSGAASTDIDGPGPLSFSWAFGSRPAASAAALVGETSATPSFAIDVAGTYRIRLVVSDGVASSAPDEVVIATDNSPPVAHAGPDQSVFVGNLVTLNGTASTDVDGNPLAFRWTLAARPAASAATLTGANTAQPTFTADRAGAYTVQLVVNDGIADSAPDTVTVTTGNTAPVANLRASCSTLPNADCTVALGTTVGLDGSASTDVDGDPLSYAWSLVGAPPGSVATIVNAASVSASFAADAPGDFIVQLVAGDGTAPSAPRTIRVTTSNVKPTARPTIAPVSIPAVPSVMRLDGSASTDPEQQTLAFAWSLTARPAGSTAALSNPTAVAPSFTADRLGTYTAQLIVSDGFLSSDPATVTASSANQPPVADAGSDQAVTAGVTVQLTGTGSSDPEGHALGYFWSMLVKPAGSAADLVPGANATNPSFVADLKGTYVVQLIVNDGVLDSVPDTVQILAGNRSPVASADAYTTQEDTTLAVSAGAGVLANDGDADGDPLSAAVVGIAPFGLSLDRSGAFIYTPAANFSGTVAFQYRASDGTADSNTVTVTVEVTPLNDPPIARAGPNQSVAAGAVVQLTGAGSADPESQPLTYAWTLPTRPAGSAAALSDASAVNPTFVADVAGTYAAHLVVSDGVLTSAAATVTIVAAANLPTVTVAATVQNASETGPVDGVFTFTRTGPTTSALTVSYAIAGTATNSIDFTAISTQVTIPAGQASGTVMISPRADALIEPAETVILTVQPNAATYGIGTPASATLTIADAVPNVVSVTATGASETGPVTGEFMFVRSGPTTFPLTVSYAITGSATNSIDYTAISTQMTIPAGQAAGSVSITPRPDTGVEGTETVILTVQPSPSTYVVGTPASATLTIADAVPDVVAVTAADGSETGPVDGVFIFTRTGPATFPLTVSYSIGGTATNSVDYTAISTQMTIPAGQASGTVTISPRPDALIEPAETVVLTIQPSPSTYLVGAPANATLTIADAVPNVVSVTGSDGSETGPADGAFTFTRTGPATFPLTVSYAIAGLATNSIDYTAISTQMTIAAGQATGTLVITPRPDAVIEGSETVIVTIQPSPSTYLVGTPASATLSITDAVPNVVSVTATNASETGPVDGVFTFARSGPTTFPLTVTYSIGGTATNSIDYTAISTQMTIAAGQASGSVVIAPRADAVIDPDETVILTIQPNAASYMIGTPGSATMTISEGSPDAGATIAPSIVNPRLRIAPPGAARRSAPAPATIGASPWEPTAAESSRRPPWSP